MGNTNRKGKERDDVAQVVAGIHRVDPSYVRKVRNGTRDNDDIMATVVEYQLGKSALIQHLERLIKIVPNPAKYARKKD